MNIARAAALCLALADFAPALAHAQATTAVTIACNIVEAKALSVDDLKRLPAHRVEYMSLGGDGPCVSSYEDAVSEVVATGAVIVISAGNSAGHAVSAPANCSGVIAVAGLRHVGTKVGFSNLGPEVALGAPGGNCVNLAANSPCLYPILTTSNTGTMAPTSSTYTDSFNASLGTSFSAPLVAGTVALMT